MESKREEMELLVVVAVVVEVEVVVVVVGESSLEDVVNEVDVGMLFVLPPMEGGFDAMGAYPPAGTGPLEGVLATWVRRSIESCGDAEPTVTFFLKFERP